MAGLVGIRAARGAINQGEEKGREKGGKVLKRWWWFVDEKKKKTIIGSLSSSLYTHLRYRRRIFFLFSFRGSKFNNSRHANPRYEETLLGNLLSVHGCVSIYFIYRLLSPPIRSSSQVDLWISLPVFFTILFESRVTFILARLSGPRAR